MLPASGVLKPLPLDAVTFRNGLWAEIQDLNHATMLGHCLTWLERVGWIANFDRAASGEEFDHAGIEFVDSEVYKLLEAMALEIGRTQDPDLERTYDALVERIAAAQDPSGYLHTAFGRPWQRPRYSDLEWGHELYCFGHLFQAAAARVSTGRGGRLPEVAIRLADHVYEEFGPHGRDAVGGHPEIEPALVELSRATGELRYLELAQLFVDRRGRGTLGEIEFGRAYFQDDVPVREADVLRGHAVRALYLTAGGLDVAADTGDGQLLEALRRQYDRTIARRTYITGGLGSHHQDEAFGEDFELPPDRAYAETCAAIASVMVAWRLLLATGDTSYADIIERTLLNAVICSPAADGRAFFYTNTLHQRVTGTPAREDLPSLRARSSMRAPWFAVSCCPTNLARTLARTAGYTATLSDRGVQLHQYGSYTVRAEDLHGRRVSLDVESDYPHDGTVSVTLREPLADGAVVELRVPAWARGEARLRVGATAAGAPVDGSAAVVEGPLAAGTTVTLELSMRPRLVEPDPRIDAVRGQVAVEKGPFVLALEDIDLPGDATVNDVRIDTTEALTETPDGAQATVVIRRSRDERWPYADHDPAEPAVSANDGSNDRRVVPLRYYYRWGNRGPTTMRVFLPAEARR